MAIQTREYELTVWTETLNQDGTKTEKRLGVIGAHDMTYLGRANTIKFVTKLNGTHTISFKMPDKYFDSEKGEFVQNELRDLVANERKVKLHYKGKWHEFFVKNVNQTKKYKSYMYEYSGTDAYIDELVRNGYDITFDTELYNNVEEIGVFTEEILDGSQWTYSPENNIGDFTEFIEEKLFKIPISQFKNGKVSGYKLKFEIDEMPDAIVNAYTKKKRGLEMGDDLARINNYYWDNYEADNGFKIKDNKIDTIETDGYIYVPYSQLGFCYVTTGGKDNYHVATEEPSAGTIGGVISYYVAPTTIDPSAFIQFIAIPKGAKVEIDESGLIVNKDYTYVMTVEQWNENINGNSWYLFEDQKDNSGDTRKKIVTSDEEGTNKFYGNKITTYDGYLSSINAVEVDKGKKISISNRTEKNISEEIDQYVTVYNNQSSEYEDYYSNPDWTQSTDGYRVCSKIDTRQIIPKLARNYIQNGVNVKSTDGWEVQQVETGINKEPSAEIKFVKDGEDNEDYSERGSQTYLSITANKGSAANRTLINFGAIGQEKIIEKDKIYCLGLVTEKLSTGNIVCIIGQGTADTDGDYSIDENNSFTHTFPKQSDNNNVNNFVLIKSNITIKNPYICLLIPSGVTVRIKEFWFFEAYTKGKDFFSDAHYRYSGRDMLVKDWTVRNHYSYKTLGVKADALNQVLFETDIMKGTTYEYRRYFIQGLKLNNTIYDTFNQKEYLSATDYKEDAQGVPAALPLNSAKYTADNYEILTNYINLNACKYYIGNAKASGCDCAYQENGAVAAQPNRVCMYQKYGYCPYLFETEKHCRRTRTLTSSKSNRFNLTQEIGKIFEIYPIYYIEHNNNGTIKTDENGKPIKRIFYMTEKGKENKIGFRYEKNLNNISKHIVSDAIVTKLYVEDNDSELSRTGMCSIKTAEDNPSKDNFIIDLSYYVKQGMLDEEQVLEDLYGKNRAGEDVPLTYAFLKNLGYYNTEYDKLSNKIINLQNQEFNDLEAQIEVNITGIETAIKELRKNKKQLARYSGNTKTDTYENYQEKITEQTSILIGLINDTFYTNGNSELIGIVASDFIGENGYTLEHIKEDFVGKHTYMNYGLLGQYNTQYKQIQDWKKEQAKYLKDINDISQAFFYRYEPYLKEGTWTNSNYLTDNAYYHDAVKVAAEGAIPKVEYNITVTPLGVLDEDYDYEIADTTYVEDIGMFGINKKTGLPNRLKVIISELNETVDIPTNDTIGVQNFTTQFEDLFEQVTASVQSLTLNENIYHRASNFTSNQNIKNDSLQGALDTNDLTLVQTTENNVKIDATGQSGSDINNHNNKYKLNGQGLFFSNNGGQTWNVGVGPGGINADYIKTGTLDAGNIRIVDNNYVYFLWDKGGITAYREPTEEDDFGKDFARFNKYGLSLVENNKIRLRAGYEFKTKDGQSIDGNINNEDPTIKDQNVGFYLYNTNGQSIFSTETGEDDISARINLTGEIYARAYTDLSAKTIYEYSGRYTLNKREFYYITTSTVSTEPTNLTLIDNYCIVNKKNTTNYYQTKVFSKDNTYYTEIDEQWYKVSRNNSSIYILVEDKEDEKIIIIDKPYSRQSYTIINLDDNTSITKQLFHSSGAQSYYYEAQAIVEPTDKTQKTGVYYNHRAINGVTEKNGYYTRLLTCVKSVDGGNLNNIFSILSDGSLYIGGEIKTKESSKKTLDGLDNYVQINSSGIVLTSEGDILLNGLSLTDEMNRKINEVAAAALNTGLIQHNHSIPVLEIERTIEETKLFKEGTLPDPEKMSLSETSTPLELEKCYIKVYGTESDDNPPNSVAKVSTHYISLNELLNSISYETRAGQTDYTGTVGGSGTSYNGEYYSTSGIVDVATEVVRKYYENTLAIGYGYDQGHYIDFIANGHNIHSRCDCSGLVSAIWQALGDCDTGYTPDTYSMLNGGYPSSWRMFDYDRSKLQPGDVVLAQQHVNFISDLRNGILYAYDFGANSHLEQSYTNTFPFSEFSCLKIIRRIEDISTLEGIIPIDRSIYDSTAGANDNQDAVTFYFTGKMSQNFCGPYPSSVEILNSNACKGLRRIIQSCKGEFGVFGGFATASYAKLYRATIIGNRYINNGTNDARDLETWLSQAYSNRSGWMGTANTGLELYSSSDLPLAQAIYNNLRYPDLYGVELHTGSNNFKNAIIKAMNGIPLHNGCVGDTWAAPPNFAVLFNVNTDTDEGISGQPRLGTYLMYRSAQGSIDMFNTNVYN